MLLGIHHYLFFKPCPAVSDINQVPWYCGNLLSALTGFSTDDKHVGAKEATQMKTSKRTIASTST